MTFSLHVQAKFNKGSKFKNAIAECQCVSHSHFQTTNISSQQLQNLTISLLLTILAVVRVVQKYTKKLFTTLFYKMVNIYAYTLY